MQQYHRCTLAYHESAGRLALRRPRTGDRRVPSAIAAHPGGSGESRLSSSHFERPIMKITDVVPLVLGTPWRNLTFLKVETDEGIVGVSEARCVARTSTVLAYLEEVKHRYVIGSDPMDIEALVHRMFHRDFARVDDVAGTGIALVEMACWDIIGKALNQPVNIVRSDEPGAAGNEIITCHNLSCNSPFERASVCERRRP